jgi:methyl-accepting chemotaxis protein
MGWLENMILRSKLILLTSVMVIALAVLGFIGFNITSGWMASNEEVGHVRLKSIVGLAQMRTGMNQIAIQQNRIRAFDRDYKAQATFEDAVKNMETGFKNIDKGLKIYEPLPQTKEEEAMWKEFMENYSKWRKMSEDFKGTVAKLAANQDPKVQDEIFSQVTGFVVGVRTVRTAAVGGIEKVATLNEALADKNIKESDDSAAKARTLISTVIAVSLLLSIILAILIIRSVTASITKAVTTINDGALQISSASDQVASSSTSLAQGASEQASSVEEVSATLEEATAGVTSNTENARQADILAKEANKAAKEGLGKGEELVVSMKEVTESAAKIANIVKTIDQIAFQVNLLALNAAVEAARAGEHGLGFAVVADEVRNLAQRAANSAKETGIVIEEAVTQIKKGSEIANAASNSFREIDDKAKKVSDLIGEVTLSSREQAEGMGQLSMAMSQIDQVTQQVAANSEEAAAASEELNAQAAAAIEAVAVLAKIVGIDVNQSMGHQKPQSRPRMELKKDIKHISSKPSPRQQQAPRQASKDSNDIFPLDESDLKEF